MLSLPHTARRGLAVAMLLAVVGQPVLANQTDSGTFSLSLRGIPAGELKFSGTINATSYAVNGTLRSTGILGAVRKVRYDAAVQGSHAQGRFTPSSYTEKADTSKRQSESVMAYKAGVPQVEVYNPPRAPRPGDIDPATQGGTIDPLTALFAVLRDVPEAQACSFSAFMFDGRRRSQIALTSPQPADDGTVTCAGEYRRLAGFSDKEMAEKVSFPFRLTYVPTGDGQLRVDEVSMDTLYGKGRLKRR
ncbi:DUF3108 domain-containing protein [Phaeovulum sp. NW3]|uniref:DUF3108 domain-containing protein n=1 Tax=Phaeovulum sp. NW3 TaxID=2934933 RepID=UPI0020221A33|nr:DUF3108 domain-containing protein [Phaeovulum sp. NW3]MCL7463653.1 DUF3108 domain-containing protein [Phaeovulum sp. NW3]